MRSTQTPSVGVELSARDARRIALRAQGLLGRRLSGGPLGLLRHLRAVQIDTISVLARSHELVAYSRLGPVSRDLVEAAYWGGRPPSAFEYWSHAACVVPIEDWPNFGFKRADRRARGRRWHHLDDEERACSAVIDKLRSEGPLTARQLGGAKRGGPWWDWSEVKIAAEWLLDIGEVVCTTRSGFQRVYDLPERAIPAALLSTEPPRDEQIGRLLASAATALGVAAADDFAAYCGLSVAEVRRILPHLGLTPVSVEGWARLAFASPQALEDGAAGVRSRPVLLSPFDSIIWYRPRVERLFGFHHRLEAYVPKPLRVHGYYSMPVLVGDRLVARVDPGREGTALVAKNVHFEPWVKGHGHRTGVGAALREAARWVGCDKVVLERVHPEAARAAVEEGGAG